MKKSCKWLTFIAVFTLMGCHSDGAFDDSVVITKIEVTPSDITLVEGQEEQLVALATYSNNQSRDITDSVVWESTDIVTITDEGLVLGIDAGMTTVTASKGGVTSDLINVVVKDAVVTEIEVTVASAVPTVLQKIPYQLTAVAMFSDGTSADISSTVEWTSDDVAIAEISSEGIFTAKRVGHVTVIASVEGIESNALEIDVNDLSGAYIDVFDHGNGHLATSSPSVAYLDSIDSSSGTNAITITNETFGPLGDFYRFSQSEAVKLCEIYNTVKLSDRTNWTLADENLDLSISVGNMTELRGWPGVLPTWTTTDKGAAGYVTIHLQREEIITNAGISTPYYAVCTSAP